MDAEKAFDHVAWDYMHLTLIAIGLQSQMLAHIMALPRWQESELMVPAPFKISNGAGQGACHP